jgi:superfamily II DNA/RNA helicase
MDEPPATVAARGGPRRCRGTRTPTFLATTGGQGPGNDLTAALVRDCVARVFTDNTPAPRRATVPTSCRAHARGLPLRVTTHAHRWASGDLVTTSFADLGVPTDLADRLHADGLTDPFPIQRMTLPDALAGRDLCGRAPTGSGKTLAFALPVVQHVARARAGRPTGLILVPTRELASQVADTLRPLAGIRGRRVATFYGGTNIRRDQQRLRNGVDIAVACPGRLADLVQRGDCALGDVTMVVLDEADRMADMGFLPEVKRLLDQTSRERQTLLFSATLDGDVDQLVTRYQHDPARHELESDEEDAEVRHVFWPAERDQRRRLTADIVRRVGPAIVFTRTKHGADRLAKQLAKDGIGTAAIHGNRSQNQRERALARFADGDVSTLVATDVAARGIHVDDVGVVVHYDLPASDKDYVHRSGRTGRAGATGLVVSLVDQAQGKDTAALQRMLELPQGLHEIDLDLLTADELPAPITALDTRPARQGTPSGGNRGNGGRQRSQGGGNRGGGNGGSGRQRSGGGSGTRGARAGNGTGGGTRGGARARRR